MIKVNDGIEAVEVKLIFRDKRKKQTILIKHPNIDYSIQNDIQPVYSMGGAVGEDGRSKGGFGPVEYVYGGFSTIELNIRGRATPSRRRR